MIRVVEEHELTILKDMFWKHISNHSEYISHGEMQMGVGKATLVDDDICGCPAEDGQQMWMKYIRGKFESSDAQIYVAVDTVGELSSEMPSVERICGFCVVEITDDGAEQFGMLCDILVDSSYRGNGVGSELFDAAMAWFRNRGIDDIYLESGKRNEAAHEFFRRRGFRHVSEIFKLK